MSVSEAIGQALSADQLTEALKLALDAVKAKPQDAQARLLLIDLLILSGDYERADKQADAAAKISPVDAVGLSILRGQVRGLDARHKWFREGAVPAFPGGPSPADEAALRFGLALREKDGIAARAAYEALEAARERSSLSWNGAPAPDFRDADDRLFHAFEVITTGGSYLWVEFARVESLALEPIRRPRDLAVRRATLTLKSGSAAEVLIPAIYGIASELSDPLRLGRQTDWIELPGGLMAGQGQRCFLVGEEIEPLAAAESIDAAAEEAALG